MTETLVFTVPVELKDVVTNVVNQIIGIKNNIYAAAGAETTAEVSRTAETHEFEKPSQEEVSRYLASRRSPVNPQRFYSWMEKHNWHDGNGEPITDWKQKVADWEAREPQRTPQTRVQRMNSQLIQHTDSEKPKSDDAKRLLKMYGLDQKYYPEEETKPE